MTDIVKQLQGEFGKENIVRLNDTQFDKIDVIPTGISGIDNDVFLIGGFPRGRITQIRGTESSCKTTLCLTAAAEVQKTGGEVAIIDLENALSKDWCEVLGVDVDKLIVSQPDNAEVALEILQGLVESKLIDLVILDSIDALVPQSVLDGGFGDSNMGVVARLMSQALRKLTTAIRKSKTAVIFISQIRNKIGVMYGSPETEFGGLALKYYASLRVDTRITKKIEGKENEIIGNLIKIKTIKNKCARPYMEKEVEFIYNKGFDKAGDLLDTALKNGIIVKSGAWFSFDNENIAQGRQSAKIWLETNSEKVLGKLTSHKTA